MAMSILNHINFVLASDELDNDFHGQQAVPGWC